MTKGYGIALKKSGKGPFPHNTHIGHLVLAGIFLQTNCTDLFNIYSETLLRNIKHPEGSFATVCQQVVGHHTSYAVSIDHGCRAAMMLLWVTTTYKLLRTVAKEDSTHMPRKSAQHISCAMPL